MPMALGLGLGLPYIAAASGPYPALDLNFATMATLDSRITYTGASLATLVNAAGNIAYKPHNLLTYSGDLSNAVWTKTLGASTTSGSVTIGAGAASEARNIIYLLTASKTFTASVQIAVASGTAKFRIKNTHGGVVDNYSSDLTATTTPQWFSLTVNNAASAGDGSQTVGIANASDASSNGVTFLVTGAQLNIGPLQPYYPTTSAAYYGPRFTYDPVTHAALGLLIEEQRTNLFLWSRDFSSAAWTKQASASTAVRNAVGVDGIASSASTITESAGYFARSVYQPVTGSSGAYSTSVSFQQAAGPTRYLRITVVSGPSDFGYVTVNLKTGAIAQAAAAIGTASAASATVTYQPSTGMWRVSLSCTLAAAPTFVFFVPIDATPVVVAGDYGRDSYTGDGSTSWVLDAAQFEPGSFATTPIHTTSASVTRAADSATMTGSNFSSWFNATHGTFVAQFVVPPLVASTYKRVFSARNVADTERVEVWVNGAGTIRIGSTTGGATTETSLVAAVSAGQVCKAAASYTAAGMSASLNGGTVYTHSATVNGAVMTVLDVGLYDAANHLCAPISRLRYYNTALTNAQLQALTT